MTPNLNHSPTYHSRFCATRYKRQSLLFLSVCLALTFVNWNSLNQPSTEQGPLMLLFGHLAALAILTHQVVTLKCLRERLVIAVPIAQLSLGLLGGLGLLPDFVPFATRPIKEAFLFFWVLASGLSLSMLVSALRSSGSQPGKP